MLDTNVVVSGIFFGGIPRSLLESWSQGRFELVLTPAIFDEYLRTCLRLGATRPELEFLGLLTTLIGHGTLVPDDSSDEPITADPDDDKFLLCARRTDAFVVSGDRDLLDASGWRGVSVLTPREFAERLDAPRS